MYAILLFHNKGCTQTSNMDELPELFSAKFLGKSTASTITMDIKMRSILVLEKKNKYPKKHIYCFVYNNKEITRHF